MPPAGGAARGTFNQKHPSGKEERATGEFDGRGGGGMRTLLQDVEHKGYIFPKGWKVKYHIDFSNWDKQLWGEDMMSPMSDNAPKSATASNAVFDICSRDLSGMPLVTLLVQVRVLPRSLCDAPRNVRQAERP
ncbi:hypothetical protein CYMTET_26617 [Cymbomonas tetramitiformis]|uniref:Uncharacterized protein n=1 Tax=Cymbomonas tetramitiformis TaxID=36881 RepID=A0AAE0FRZ0_9CHLO|nr:hypothetical protein CYMTET_26617 [Cymbomonas tetramitiformis]